MRCHIMSCHVTYCQAMARNTTSYHVTPSQGIHVKSSQTSSKGNSGTKYQVNTKLNYLTGYEINIISPRSPFAVPTSIGSSIFPECQVSSWTCRTPSLMLNCKGSVTTPGGCRKALVDGGGSSSVETADDNVFAVHLWNCSAARVSETTNRFDCRE